MAEEATAAQGDTTTAEATTASTQAPQEEASQTEAQPTEATETPKPEATEAKAEESKAEEKTEAKEGKPDRGLLSETDNTAPESYEDFKFPEGVEVTPEDQEALKTLAKEHGLSQEEAQKATQFGRSIVEQITSEEQKAIEQFREENKKAWESNPEHKRLTLLAEQGIKKLGTDVESYLSDNGYLHDAKILSILAEVGRLSSEATHVAGTDSPQAGSGKFYTNSPELY